MKRLFLAVLAALLLAAALAAAIAYDPGYILIAFGAYTLETTVWVGVALVLLILVVMYLVILLLHRSVRQGSVIGRWRAGWNERRSRQLTQRGLLAYVEGHFERARVMLDRAAARAESPVVNYLLAARAAHAQGEDKLCELYLLRAQRSGEDDLAVAVTRADLQLQRGQLQEALATLAPLRQRAAKHPQILKLLQDIYTALRDWQNVLELLPQLRRHKILTREQAASFEKSATINLFNELAAQRQLEKLRQHWQQVPRQLERDAEVVGAYARGLAALDAGAEAEQQVRQQLKREWSTQLVAIYGTLAGSDPARQLAYAEQWLQQHLSSAELLLCLGRLALRNQLWGKARDYFESSLKITETPQAYAELGRLLAQLGQHERSSGYYERGLLVSLENKNLVLANSHAH
ncbi:MAG TPA: heme biosynthesis HemY N-terminal domain-containing protein [Spongiibacteraceae bacterium]|nr:heme biosynthesis HemY N-terminal domain-containing protein [Spongiibacteraceae bacterium]